MPIGNLDVDNFCFAPVHPHFIHLPMIGPGISFQNSHLRHIDIRCAYSSVEEFLNPLFAQSTTPFVRDLACSVIVASTFWFLFTVTLVLGALGFGGLFFGFGGVGVTLFCLLFLFLSLF